MKLAAYIWLILLLSALSEAVTAAETPRRCYELKSGFDVDPNLTNAKDLPQYYILEGTQLTAVTEGFYFEDNATMAWLDRHYNEVNCQYVLKYKADTAGGLMITEYVAYEEYDLVSQVLHDLQVNRDKYKNYNVQYLYV